MEENRSLQGQFSLASKEVDDPSKKHKKGSSENSNISIFRKALSYSSSSMTIGESIASTLCWIGFALFGWYFPRFLVDKETSIVSLPPPYQIGGGDTVIVDFELNQPLVDPPTVNNFLLRSTSIFLPLFVLVLHSWYAAFPSTVHKDLNGSLNVVPTTAQKVHRVAIAVSAFSAAIGLSEGSTVLIKLWVQRRRPNFYALCGFDVLTKTCRASVEHIREANFSFPSGHSSLVCCGMTFLVWYLHGSFGTVHSRFGGPSPSILSLLVCTCLPWGWTLFVASSRLVNHWHHPSDVLAGLGLGFATCTVAYHHWYPPVWSPNAGIPRSLLFSRTNSSSGITNYGTSRISNSDSHNNNNIPTTKQSTTSSTLIGGSLTTTTKRRQHPVQSPEDMA